MSTFLERLEKVKETNGTGRKRGRPAKSNTTTSGNNAVNRKPNFDGGNISSRSRSDSEQRSNPADSGISNNVAGTREPENNAGEIRYPATVKQPDASGVRVSGISLGTLVNSGTGGRDTPGSSSDRETEREQKPASQSVLLIPAATGTPTEAKKRGRPAGSGTGTSTGKKNSDTTISADFIADLMETGFSLVASQRGEHWVRTKSDCKDVAEPAARILDKMPKEQLEKIMLFADPIMLVFGMYLLVQPAIAEDVKIQNAIIRQKRNNLAGDTSSNQQRPSTDSSNNRGSSETESRENPYSFNNGATPRN